MELGTKEIKALTLVFSILLSVVSTAAQEKKDDETLSFMQRWSFRTNVVEWVATIPNLGVEFDLDSSPYNRMTLGLLARYNWDTWHNYSPSTVFNLFEVRPEVRYYWRTTNSKRENAATIRAYYVGGYIHGGTYSIKFTEKGRQGSFYGLGASIGYGIPLYAFKKNYLDLELGLSIGALLTEYEVFTHNPVGNYYTKLESETRKLHVLPFPVVSELKVAFVFRTFSIKNKYEKVKPKQITEKQQLRETKKNQRKAAKAERANNRKKDKTKPE